MNWEINNERGLVGAERKSLSLPNRGEIDPQIWDEYPCDHSRSVARRVMCQGDGCKNVAVTTYVIISGRECHEGYTDIDVCLDHKQDVMKIYGGEK